MGMISKFLKSKIIMPSIMRSMIDLIGRGIESLAASLATVHATHNANGTIGCESVQ